jgi:plasmid replication initiation protein
MSKELKPYKSSKLNTANFGNMTQNDYNVYLHLISKIVKVDDKGNYLKPDQLKREYHLTAKEYNQIFNCDIKNAYSFLKKACKKLMKTSVNIEKVDLKQIWEINVCSHAVYNENEGSITVMFTDSIMPYLSQVRDQFVIYNLKEVSNFKSIHSIRLYEQIQQFKDTGYFVKSLSQLRNIFAVGNKYKNYNDLKKKTFAHAVKEINKHYHIDLDFQEIKEGRKVAAIKFTFKKTKIAKRYRQDGTYTNEYIKPKEKSKYPDIVLEGQLSFEEKTQNQEQAGNAASNIIQNLKIN